MKSDTLSQAETRALAVLAGGDARYSNRTTDVAPRSIYWQAADSLVRRGLARGVYGAGSPMVVLSDNGRVLVAPAVA